MEERYTLGTEIGEGAFGRVFLAIEKRTGKRRAIKRIKDSLFTSWDEVAGTLREVQALIQIGYHSNIVQLLEVHRQTDQSIDLVFAYIPDGSLQDLFHHRRHNRLGPPPANMTCNMLSQILQALAFVHGSGWIHRDVKPDNLLLQGNHCKLADFSLARPVWSSSSSAAMTTTTTMMSPHPHALQQQQQQDRLTTYVSTRWYRAPEIILAAPDYSTPVDLFATGCIVAEFVQLVPLFPGRDQMDQLWQILSMLGSPQQVGWKKGQALMERLGLIWPSNNDTTQQLHPRDRLAEWLLRPTKHTLEQPPPLVVGIVEDDPTVVSPLQDHCLVDLVFGLLTLDPDRRWTAEQALQHPYFASLSHPNEAQQQQQQLLQQQDTFPIVPLLASPSAINPVTTTPPNNNNINKENDSHTHDKVAVTVSASYKQKDSAAMTMTTMTSPLPLCEDNHQVSGKHQHWLQQQQQQSSPDDSTSFVMSREPKRIPPTTIVNPYLKQTSKPQTTPPVIVKNPYGGTKLRLTRVPGK